ncbi:zinc ribbon domain-containing protein [Deinococcus peraridilitoris]|uniref:Zn-ribbon protein, possibly nucleic acid-binding protein n=1 Tax=Deinococcus peraridilitoris (strain DSM 19664 / LMG 22246 / CIP 109416 / KR-200) TaxID=937777 RepID=K9ZXI3_DEIPD|nr:C4-type zinc ribbon domain-containing protein [Deinococcus peraridilitoris]AFZ65914.1 Zn-ribbon protein, possibly nucleic acid-binding protein [Deinococcus peraridilitoris DSM 19664]
MNDSGPLERLYKVQQLDLQLDQLQAEELSIPQGLRDARAEQEQINNVLEDVEIELEHVGKNVRQLEQDLASTRDQVARNKGEQEKNAFNAKVQSQYENLIQQLSERATDYEESLAPLYERRGKLNERRTDLRSQHAELRPQIGQLEGEDEARVAGLREQQETIRKERDELASSIETRFLKEYEMIRKAKRGTGIVGIEAGRCTGCNMQLPVTVQQRVTTAKLPPVKCPSCGRFLIKLT